MKFTKEIKTGIVVVVAVAITVYGFNFLKGRDIFSTSTDLYAIYDDVNGLTSNNTVMINGYKVGTVRDVKMDPKTNKLIVHFIITENNAIITDSSRCEIFSDGLLGYKAIRITTMPGGKPVQDKDTLVGTNEQGIKEEVSAMVLPLKKKIESLVGSVDSVVQIFQVVLNENAREDLVHSFSSIRNSLATLEKTSFRLDTMVASESARFSAILVNIQSISTNLANNNEPLSRAINNFANISDSIAKSRLKTVIDSASSVMAKTAVILEKINNGTGTMGLLLNDKKLYDGIVKSNADLDALIIDLKEHPKRYFSVFGRDKKSKKTPPPPPAPKPTP